MSDHSAAQVSARVAAAGLAAFYGVAAHWTLVPRRRPFLGHLDPEQEQSTPQVTRGQPLGSVVSLDNDGKGWGVGYFLLPSLALVVAGGGRYGLLRLAPGRVVATPP